MRVVLFTGKGGVGKTTIAAATATAAAARGHKTLLVTTDPAPTLAEVFDAPVAPDGSEVAPGLVAALVDPALVLRQTWGRAQPWLSGVLTQLGAQPVLAEELTVFPGAEEVAALLALREHVRADRYDVVIVDCAPSGETLRLLALPEALAHFLGRSFPLDAQIARLVRLGRPRGAGEPPGAGVFAAVRALLGALEEVRDVLRDPHTSVRIVLTPEVAALAEARRTYTALAVHGYRVDGVLANRVLPPGALDPRVRGWAAAQEKVLAQAREAFAPHPVLVAGYGACEPVGAEALGALGAALYEGGDPVAPGALPDPLRVLETTAGYALHLPVPFCSRADLELSRLGDDLLVRAGDTRRVLALPAVLRRCQVSGADHDGVDLVVRFVPDPALWSASVPRPGAGGAP